ncbi:hypothetical protein L2747_09965 [Shewanella marinintestina]|uniref:hypothetical protein n=1 Tax=Shewanella marinintestina TaxID=190305 RepID=UPI00200F8F90|nr:hypothetical protein [Shewanella marinintestina]MCL1146321.1 hypothetical protein [Shewanella marinintestina]
MTIYAESSFTQKLLLLLSVIFTFPALAIEPLEKDEGYVLVALKVEQGYLPTYVTLSGEGWGNGLKYDLKPTSTNYWLEAVEAGTYEWDRLYLNKDVYLDIEDAELTIKVEPGKINYGGHLLLHTTMNASRNSLLGGARFYFNNKASKAMTYLDNNFPSLVKDYDLIYTGEHKDHFFDYAKQLKGVKL